MRPLSELGPDSLAGHSELSNSAPYINMHGIPRHVGNIDEIMQPGGIVTGVVTAATNLLAPLSGICVFVFENNGLYDGASATTGARRLL